MLFLPKFNNPARNPGARTRTCSVLGHQAGGGRGRAGQFGSVFPPHSHSRPRRKHVRTYAPDPAADGGRRLPSRFLGGSDFKGRLEPFEVDFEGRDGTRLGFWTNTMPPSPRRPLPIPPAATSLATPNMPGQTTSVQHLTRPSAKQYFLLTSGNDCIRGRSAYKSPRSDGMLSSSSVQSVSLSVPFSLPPNQEAHQGPKQQF